MEKLNKKQIASKLQVTQETVRNWVTTGVLVPDENNLVGLDQLDKLDLSRYEDSDQWVTIQKTCEILEVTRATVFNYCAARLLERATLRGRSYISLGSIAEVLNQKKASIDKRINNLALETVYE